MVSNNFPFQLARLTVVCLVVVCSGTAFAQTISVPDVAEDVGYSGLNTPIRSVGRVYQAYYDQVNFQSITQPVLITGMQYRLALDSDVAVGQSWPSQPLAFANYDVQLSRGSAAVQANGEFISASVPFADNQGGTVTTTRTGPLTIPANSFTNTGNTTANPFGLLIDFSSPYLYTPGQELVLTFRHDGYTPASELQPYFASSNYSPHFADAVRSLEGYTATVPDNFTDPIYVQFTFAPVPEPAGVLGGCALAGAGVAALRRRKG